jgi:hypothetical protein
MYQQPVVNTKAIRIGSVKVELSDDGVSFTSFGTGDKAKFAEKLTTQDITSDNGGLIMTIVKDQSCEVSYTMKEVDLNILQQARGAIDEYSTVAGTATTVTAEAHGTGWTVGQPIKLVHKNGANTVVTSIVVKSGSTTLASGTDYNTYVGDGSNGELGYTYIVPITAQTGVITVGYSYTPLAAMIIKSGGKTTISSKYLRLTNTNAEGKKFQITVYKAQNADGISIDFPGDDEGKAWELPVKFSGSKDAARSVGDQLFTIYDEQSVA